MRTYTVAVKYSKDGRLWTNATKTVRAESDMSAIAQVSSMYRYVKDVRILSVR